MIADSIPSSRRFNILAKPVGPACNLECLYCFYREKAALYPDRRHRADWQMPEDILELFIQQYVAAQPEDDAVSFAWQGGEPTLLGVEYFENIVALQAKHASGKRIENTLQTNGLLLDDRWCEFLAANRFLVGISIDGPEEIHDRHRRDPNGGPTFARVMQSVARMKKHGVDFNTLTTVPDFSARRPLEIYRFLRGIGHGFLQFIPIVERAASAAQDGLTLVSPDSPHPARVTEWSVDPLEYGKFLAAIFDEWVRNDVGRVFVQLFDVALAARIGTSPGLCVFEPTCGSAAVLEHNGDVYACDHYVYPENRLGNIRTSSLDTMLHSQGQIRFGSVKQSGLPEYCRRCPVLFACNGECPKHRFARTPDGEPGLNYLCAGYRHFFTHAVPFLDFMADELRTKRPPANVMAWARQRDLSAAGTRRPGRNDPCPCGSGLKFKRCCGRN